ncbi:hypothetical protein [Pseudomonas putida]|jgi:hypothetical protein|uniref:hypothetical protein n=1 Tax=Pseudomonas umsongensis TaxID=198618 RepID=UPI0004D86BB7|nr:hypothetical protein HA62_15080 [Pseudomonas putida]
MIDMWPTWVSITVVGGPFLLGVVGIAYSLYLGRHLDVMMGALKNSRYIAIWGPGLRTQGWFGCLMLVAKIAGMVMMPNASIRSGELDPEDIKNFPPHLKRLLKIKAVMLVVSGVWLLIGSLLVKFR